MVEGEEPKEKTTASTKTKRTSSSSREPLKPQGETATNKGTSTLSTEPLDRLVDAAPNKKSVDAAAVTEQKTNPRTRSITVSHPFGPNNEVHTNKYTLYNFIPKFLFEQFSEFANLFFLVIMIIQFFPAFNLYGPQATSAPLALIIFLAGLKECWEDYKRRISNRRENRQKVTAYVKDEGWKTLTWGELRASQLVYISREGHFPADLILLSSSEPTGLAYIETSTLDGETNLKVRRALPATASAISREAIEKAVINGTLTTEAPSKNLYQFSGSLFLPSEAAAKSPETGPGLQETSTTGATSGSKENPPHILDKSLFLPRGARLKNTEFVYGLIVFAGKETKFMLNSVKTQCKRSRSSRLTNYILMVQFGMLMMGAGLYTLFGHYNEKIGFKDYVFGRDPGFNENILVNIINYVMLLSGFVPISLYVTIETIQLAQASLIRTDLELYDEATDYRAEARTSTLTPQLGEVAYIMADKTGTLTRNVMIFKNCSVGGIKYGSRKSQTFNAKLMLKDLKTNARGNQQELHHFMTACAICHTVVPEKKDEEVVLHASSPDELALVTFAKNAGFVFHTRTLNSIRITENMEGRSGERVFTLLHIIEFDSVFKRMGVVVKAEDGSIRLYVKGADSVILSDIVATEAESDRMKNHLSSFARRGMRTLCFAYRDVTQKELDEWVAGMAGLEGEEKVQAEHSLARRLSLIGASAIEDRLQDRVPQTIHRILSVGIHVWILTGDKLETAVNIGFSCRLLSSDVILLVMSADSKEETRSLLRSWIEQLGDRLKKSVRMAIIVDATAIDHVLSDDGMQTDWMRLAMAAQAVICCRCTPSQKASMTRLVRQVANGCVLAIGDGGNDIAMLQESDVGVGIVGKEGMQAAINADFSISEFRHLDRLLFVHGTLSLYRLNKTILYTLYKNVLDTCIMSFYTLVAGHSIQLYTDKMHSIYYNMFYTSFAPLVLGIFDRPVPVDVLASVPAHYKMQQCQFNIKTHLGWTALAFYHAIVIFSGSYFFEKMGVSRWRHAREDHMHVYGFTMFFTMVCVANTKALLETSSITLASYSSLGFSLMTPILWLWLQSVAFPQMPWSSAELSGLVWMVPSWGFLFFIFSMIIITLAPDFLVRVIRRTFLTKPDLQEWKKGGIFGTHRPLLNPLLKMVGIKQKSGYAFAQDDGTAVSQGDVMRAYESKREAEPAERATTATAQLHAVTDKTVDSESSPRPANSH